MQALSPRILRWINYLLSTPTRNIESHNILQLISTGLLVLILKIIQIPAIDINYLKNCWIQTNEISKQSIFTNNIHELVIIGVNQLSIVFPWITTQLLKAQYLQQNERNNQLGIPSLVQLVWHFTWLSYWNLLCCDISFI